MKSIFHYLSAILLISLPLFTYATSRDDGVAVITVYKVPQGTGVSYVYSVTNKGELPIVGVTVGLDYYKANPELPTPLPTAITGPSGWAGQAVTTEELPTYEVAWTPTHASILPGQTVFGFTIEAKKEDPLFVTSHWTVTVDGPPLHASSTLQPVSVPVDTTPPQINVTLTPNKLWPPNKKIVPIVATVTATDDMDPHPTIKLESISCNECVDLASDVTGAAFGTDDRNFFVRAARLGQRKDGRVYTVTYSATDAAGNRATASATVQVPHDQGQQ